MLDKIILFPYWLFLKIRNWVYDKGIKAVKEAPMPTICLGNVTVGGTGKTPHTEMILSILGDTFTWGGRVLGVLSRGYKRRTRGFRTVTAGGSALLFGDEPGQIKNKFPEAYVAVDADRVEGCEIMSHISGFQKAAELVILDDAFQYRKLKATMNIVLVDWDRPVFQDRLLPLGGLRDLPERVGEADIIIMTKCPRELDDWEKTSRARKVGIFDYSTSACEGTGIKGRRQFLFFTTINYCPLRAVFGAADNRYIYSKQAVVFSGIARDGQLLRYLGDTYNIVGNFRFRDHHRFRTGDFERIMQVVLRHPTAAVITTEKDAQRVLDCRRVPDALKERMFLVPIKVEFIEPEQKNIFTQIISAIQ
ncbi:MAG: tetraacyldisaccharide 4'-kinase [Bacteroidales bacterium]|nr:tetraacyldisaccharide 4'-kinase [Bacteroidales bacterium]